MASFHQHVSERERKKCFFFSSCSPLSPYPKTHITKSQDRNALLCLDSVNNSCLQRAPMFSHFEKTLDTRDLAVDVFFHAGIPALLSSLSLSLSFCSLSLNVLAATVWPTHLAFGFAMQAAHWFTFLVLFATDSANTR